VISEPVVSALNLSAGISYILYPERSAYPALKS
jgi:hypothetical protein